MIRTCKVCGASYKTCYSCEKERSWRLHTDTLDHYYLLMAVMGYQHDHDAQQAYNAICKRGNAFQDQDSFTPSVRKVLAEIEDRAWAAYAGEEEPEEAELDGAEMPALDDDSE